MVDLNRSRVIGLQLGLLIAAAFAGCGIVGSLLLAFGVVAWWEVLAAGLICLVPSLLALVWNEWFVVGGFHRSHADAGSAVNAGQPSPGSAQAMSALGGMGLRMGVVATGIIVLPKVIPDWQTRPFFYSVLVVYLFLMVIETAFLLYELKQLTRTSAASPESR
ncbi:hypothetical protein Spb1_09310 [Planctopirus ephydatiae]|uniref:Uncharacterized protein n=1 Tax=Planctopirus ephydatiae TaxID=2528019 RepID=A0A518GKB7_9PLAN|nr:hypothetical protein Spb1_09310 [Planctopirus ephydatiae]